MTIELVETGLEGCFILEFQRHTDQRGWFQRSYGQEELSRIGLNFEVLQANFAYTSSAGTVRGLHFQSAPYGEDKLFHCISGSVFDVAVDLRENSLTYGKWFGTVLDSKSPKALLIPKGFAHGYLSLEDNVIVNYFVTEKYHPDFEVAISPLNKEIDIHWPINISTISQKDSEVDQFAPLPLSGY